MVTAPVDAATISNAERGIVRRTGREAHISVRQVADQAELARLRAGLETSSPAVPTVQTLETIRTDVVNRLTGAIQVGWPEQLPPLKEYALAFAPDGLRYASGTSPAGPCRVPPGTS